MSSGRSLSAVCLFLVILIPRCSHGSSEVSSQDQLTDEELHQLLYLLDDTPSKEIAKYDDNPLINLGDLLLDNDEPGHSPSDHTLEKSVYQPTTSAPTTIKSTTATTVSTTTPLVPTIDRREDITHREIQSQLPSPTNEDLVQQLSLFNSLLMSLSTENTSQTPVPVSDNPITHKTNENNADNKNLSSNNQLNEQQLALLSTLFGAASQLQTTTASFLKRQTPSPSSPQDLAALSELLTQISKAPLAQNANLNLNSITSDHLKNFHNSNANLDTASSNQLSGLLTLLGTLGSLSQLQNQQSNSLFNFGATPAPQTNFLSGFLQPQQTQQQPNIFGNLFSQQQPQQNQAQPFSLGSMIAPGISSIFTTMSNILGGSGAGGKPRVRGKGVDTRLGVGYRFGDSADAQLMWDIGPQIFTDQLKHEVRTPMIKHKRQDTQAQTHQQKIQADAQTEKQLQQAAAARRYLQVQQQNKNRRNFQVTPSPQQLPISPSQAQALKEYWALMEMQKELEILQDKSGLPVESTLSQPDLYQIARNKNFIKRASSPPLKQLNLEPTSPTKSNELPLPQLNSEPQPAAAVTNYRKILPPRAFMKKNGPPMKRNPPPGGLNLMNLNIFGRFRGPSPKPGLRPRPENIHSKSSQNSQNVKSRWDLDVNHRFDNFKNTNGELVMTDTNSKDRFFVRNANGNRGLVAGS